MDELINETVKISRKYFKELSFEDEQITSLIESGKRDLTKELTKLQKLFESEIIDITAVNLSLHALKGLFLTMGNIKIGNMFDELHNENDNSRIITEIMRLLDISNDRVSFNAKETNL